MLKISISDPTIRVKPSTQLLDYLKTVKHEETLPKNIKNLLGKKTGKIFTDEISITFTKYEGKIIDSLKKTRRASEDNYDSIESPEEQPEQTPHKSEEFLEILDLKWLYLHLIKLRESSDDPVPWLHELLAESEVILPENEYQERNPVLEARCQRLRKEQEQRLYNQMTKNVDNVRKQNPDESIGSQSKSWFLQKNCFN